MLSYFVHWKIKINSSNLANNNHKVWEDVNISADINNIFKLLLLKFLISNKKNDFSENSIQAKIYNQIYSKV